MLRIGNRTGFPAEGALFPDRDGTPVWVVAVKGTFTFAGERLPRAEQPPVIVADTHRGDPATSSLLHAAELGPLRPGTDVVIHGHACAPGGRPTKVVDVAIRVAGRLSALRVHGQRVWYRSAFGLAISDAAPFVRMPIVYERAFGGCAVGSRGARLVDERNPAGVGFHAPDQVPEDAPLPNIEDPAHEIRTIRDRPAPAGTGYVARHWLPRRALAGTYDAAWHEERRPLLPIDFDERFWLAGPAGLRFEPRLRGGEPVELLGLTPDGLLSFRLPRVAIGFRSVVNGRVVHHRSMLAAVSIDAGAECVSMVWQSALACAGRFDVQHTEIFEKRVIT